MANKFSKNTIYITGLFLIITIFIVFGVSYFFRFEKNIIKSSKSEELRAISTLKTKQISEWYLGELEDAKLISQNIYFIDEVKYWLKSENTETQTLSLRLQQIVDEHGYDAVCISSLDMNNFVSKSEEKYKISNTEKQIAQKAIADRMVISTDLYKNDTGNQILIEFIAPILDEDKRPIALVFFQQNAESFLFPLIQSWPIPAQTAETLILRKENDSIVFLNNLKHLKNPVLSIKIPLTEKDVAGVYAATGHSGIFEGNDYRKKPIIAYIDSIPNTSWFIVSKIDKDEAFNKLIFNIYSPFIISLILILLLLLFLLLSLTLQKKNSYKKMFLAQEEFRATFHSIGDAVISINKQGKILYINQTAQKLTGWSEKEAKGRQIDDVFVIISEETRKQVDNPIYRVLEKGVIVGLANHTLLISKDGKEIPIADSGAPIYDDEKNIKGVVLIFRDQTNERNQQIALLDSKRKLTTLMSNLRGMAYSCKADSEWTMLFVSKGCLELTGYESWELENNETVSYNSIILAEDREKVFKVVSEGLKKQKSFEIEYRIKTSNGEIKWVWEKGLGLFENNELTSIEGFITDISEKKRIEHSLLENEEVFDHFMKYSPVYMFFKDKDIRSLKLSPNFSEIIGLPYEELLGKTMYDLFPSEFAKKIIEDDKQILKDRKPKFIEEDFNGKKYLTVKFPVIIDGDPKYLAGFTMDITQRKIAEEALLASEHLFQTLTTNAPVGIFRTDKNGLTTYVNPRWCELSGLSAEKAMGKDWLNQVHPDDREKVSTGWQNANKEKRTSADEYRFVHNDGKTIWVKGLAIPEHDELGNIAGYIGTISDVTEIVQASETIEKSNKLLRTIIDNVPDAIYMKDTEGKKTIANTADAVNCGFKEESEILGKTDFDMFPTEIAKTFWEDDLRVLKGHAVINREEKLVSKDGFVKWLITSKIPFRDNTGKIVGLIGLGHDTTRRKQAEEEMMKLLKAVTQSPISIVITDIKGSIEYVNPKFTETAGYKFSEIKGKNSNILKSGAQNNDFYKILWETILSGNDWLGEMLNKKKNGELYWENVKISPIFNENSVITNFVAIKEDITERKKILEELIVAKEKAVESDKLKTSFLANMSHEIRTPLNSILGFTNFMTTDDTLSEDEKKEFSSIISKSADSLLQIINDIIDISSLETGQLKIFMTDIDVNPVIRSLHSVFNLKMFEVRKTQIKLTLHIMEDVHIFADENRLIQIFSNLLNNSLKFTESGEIAFGVEKITDSYVEFFVSDTGLGIPKNMQKAIFERFRQAEGTINRTYGGNGLGLSIVKNLLTLMGGSISLKSEPGAGSTFRFRLPREKKMHT
jgi:PAS domain S-box-containing protein